MTSVHHPCHHHHHHYHHLDYHHMGLVDPALAVFFGVKLNQQLDYRIVRHCLLDLVLINFFFFNFNIYSVVQVFLKKSFLTFRPHQLSTPSLPEWELREKRQALVKIILEEKKSNFCFTSSIPSQFVFQNKVPTGKGASRNISPTTRIVPKQ